MPLASQLIVEVMGRSEQGKTQPFLCRVEDGSVYFVKGLDATRASQVYEWLCAHLAVAFGLPIPSFALLEMDESLWEELPRDWRGIGKGLAFGSRKVEGARWLEAADIPLVRQELQRDILVFDWWVHNQDRSSGNHNLLWNEQEQKLAVIDHNRAFDDTFHADDFADGHAFASHWPAVQQDMVLQAQYMVRAHNALDVWCEACDTLPPEWWWANEERDVPALFDLTAVEAILRRCDQPDFWRIG